MCSNQVKISLFYSLTKMQSYNKYKLFEVKIQLKISNILIIKLAILEALYRYLYSKRKLPFYEAGEEK